MNHQEKKKYNVNETRLLEMLNADDPFASYLVIQDYTGCERYLAKCGVNPETPEDEVNRLITEWGNISQFCHEDGDDHVLCSKITGWPEMYLDAFEEVL